MNPSAPVGTVRWEADSNGAGHRGFHEGRMPAYIETGMNIVDVDDVAAGHLLAMQKGRVGERYILEATRT